MSLSVNYSFFGNGNWSIDATSGSYTNGGTIQAYVPEGSTVEAAFLYQSRFFHENSATDVTMDGQLIEAASFVNLGETAGLNAFRADVTDLVVSDVGNGSASLFDFEMYTEADSVDGFQLVVVYSNPDEDERSIILADGFSATGGDSFAVTFPEAIDTTVDGFEALMSLGIGFGYQGSSQYSTVDVDGRRLTTSAGGYDDGAGGNGGLITAGGLGDNSANPDDPYATPTSSYSDDELYDLAQGNGNDATPFLSNGATSLLIETENPSNDDNIFFVGFNILGEAIADTTGNDRPDARNDDYSVVYSRPLLSFDVLTNDVDADADDVLSITGFDDSATSGSVVMNGDGTFDYTPVYGFIGTDTFSYTVSDGELSDTATVTIQVECPVLLIDRSDLNYLEGCVGPNLMRGLRGDDEIRGNSGMDQIFGNNDNDTLFGQAGDDIVNGGRGNDLVDGGADNDTLIGGMDRDRILLGEGNDNIRGGGAGPEGDGYADVFVLDTLNNGTDTIFDFEVGLDLIDLNGASYETFGFEDRVLIEIEDGGTIVLRGVSAMEYAFAPSIFVEEDGGTFGNAFNV